LSILLKNGKKSDNTNLDLLISNGIIKELNPALSSADQVIDLNGKYILPGLIDPHVHMRDMEQSYKEDWVTGTKSALRGGITTVMDMPNTIPPTINNFNLSIKRKFAKKSKVNYGFNLGFIGTNSDDLQKVEKFNAIKVFLCESSGGVPIESPNQLIKVFKLAEEKQIPLIFHSESGNCIQKCMNQFEAKIENHHLIRNRKCAIKTTKMVIEMSLNFNCKVYFAHVATADEMDLIFEAKKINKNIFCEITPHHLLITRKKLDEIANWGRVNPPLRDLKDNKRILKAILDGTVDTIGTDHAPHNLSEKNKSYANAPSGFPGFETCLPLLLNEVNLGNLSLEILEKITSLNSSNIFNIKKRGKLREGYFADIVIIDLEKEFIVNPVSFQTKAKYSPFINMKLKGDVFMTIVNGEIGYYDGNYFNTKGIEIDYC
jgi:dihydroorotase